MRLYCVYFERSSDPFFEREISRYKKWIDKRFCITEYRIKEEPKSAPEEQVRNVINKITNRVVCLIERTGKEIDSLGFARFIERQEASGRNMIFILGPPSGFPKPSLFPYDYIISLSKMTFSHRIARLLLFEQIYRAFCIITNHPYHK